MAGASQLDHGGMHVTLLTQLRRRHAARRARITTLVPAMVRVERPEWW